MRTVITGIFLIFQFNLFAQIGYDSVLFSNSFTFADGIYKTLEELKTNSPGFPDCRLDVENNTGMINTADLYYTNARKTRLLYNASLYATVVDGRISIFYKNKLNALFLRGAISTFILQEVVTTTQYQQQSMGYGYPGFGPAVPVTTSHVETNIYFLDYETGMILKVEKDNLAPVIQRDTELYAQFSKIKGDSNHKKSYPFISQYNSRNPVYIRILQKENAEHDQ